METVTTELEANGYSAMLAPAGAELQRIAERANRLLAVTTELASAATALDVARVTLGVGLGVGLGFGLPVVAAITAFFLLRRQKIQATTLRGIPYKRGGETELEGEAGGRPGFFKRFLELHAVEKKAVYEVPG